MGGTFVGVLVGDSVLESDHFVILGSFQQVFPNTALTQVDETRIAVHQYHSRLTHITPHGILSAGSQGHDEN